MNSKPKLNFARPVQKLISEEMSELDLQRNCLTQYMEFLKKDVNTIKKIKKLHKSLYLEVCESKTVRKWKILQLKFSGILSYGNDITTIDFRKYDNSNVIGITGNNCSGKSSILDALLFGLFVQHTRGDDINMVHNSSDAIYCSILIEYDGIGYIFKTTGKKIQGELHSHRQIFTCELNDNDHIVKNTKKECSLTHQEIIGTYDEFVTTSIFCQRRYGLENNVEFIDLSPHKKMDFLMNRCKYDIFQKCINLARDKSTTLTSSEDIMLYDLYTKIDTTDIIVLYLIPKIEMIVNDTMQNFGNIRINICVKNDKIVIYFNNGFRKPASIGMASGGEILLINYAFRICLSNMIHDVNPNFFIVDDQFRIEIPMVEKIFESLALNYNNTIIISASEKVADIRDNIIEIKFEKGTSYISD